MTIRVSRFIGESLSPLHRFVVDNERKVRMKGHHVQVIHQYLSALRPRLGQPVFHGVNHIPDVRGTACIDGFEHGIHGIGPAMKDRDLKKVSWKETYLVWLRYPVSTLDSVAILTEVAPNCSITQDMGPTG